jgi:hypothetical protein
LSRSHLCNQTRQPRRRRKSLFGTQSNS